MYRQHRRSMSYTSNAHSCASHRSSADGKVNQIQSRIVTARVSEHLRRNEIQSSNIKCVYTNVETVLQMSGIVCVCVLKRCCCVAATPNFTEHLNGEQKKMIKD